MLGKKGLKCHLSWTANFLLNRCLIHVIAVMKSPHWKKIMLLHWRENWHDNVIFFPLIFLLETMSCYLLHFLWMHQLPFYLYSWFTVPSCSLSILHIPAHHLSWLLNPTVHLSISETVTVRGRICSHIIDYWDHYTAISWLPPTDKLCSHLFERFLLNKLLSKIDLFKGWEHVNGLVWDCWYLKAQLHVHYQIYHKLSDSRH